ncbi:MAG: hypothetical protein GY810_25445 [Aureispira sp.]|nr:hypothetical protein [Aureispira sp.]
MNLHIDFKVFDVWSKPGMARLVSISKVAINDLLGWMLEQQRSYQGGYTIIVNDKPWNGCYDKAIDANQFFVDHIAGAESFLAAVGRLCNGVFETAGIWQVDSSAMALERVGLDRLLLSDDVYGLEEVEVDFTTFVTVFEQTTRDYIQFLELLQKSILKRLKEEKDIWLIKQQGHMKSEIKRWKRLRLLLENE